MVQKAIGSINLSLVDVTFTNSNMTIWKKTLLKDDAILRIVFHPVSASSSYLLLS